MRKVLPLKFLIASLGLLGAISAFASSVLFAERLSPPSGTADMDVTLTANQDRIQADVRASNEPLISLIETADYAELINRKSNFVIRLKKDNTGSTNAWQPTQRRRFALGAYCEVLIATSTVTPQEVCVVAASSIMSAGAALDNTLFLGSFLAAINSSKSIDDVFANSLLAVQSAATSGLPVIVRSLDSAAAHELRFQLLQANSKTEPLPTSRKLRRITLAEAMSTVASSASR